MYCNALVYCSCCTGGIHWSNTLMLHWSEYYDLTSHWSDLVARQLFHVHSPRNDYIDLHSHADPQKVSDTLASWIKSACDIIVSELICSHPGLHLSLPKFLPTQQLPRCMLMTCSPPAGPTSSLASHQPQQPGIRLLSLDDSPAPVFFACTPWPACHFFF